MPSDEVNVVNEFADVSCIDNPFGVAIHILPLYSMMSSTYDIGNPSRAVQAVSQLLPLAFHLATPLFVAM